MMLALKNLLQDTLATRQLFITHMTDRRAVQQLIWSLRPMATAAPLIRLGPDRDGGYLVPNDLTDIEACFSPGVGAISGFELDCARLGMQVFMADRSVTQPMAQHPLFHFMPKHVGAITDDNFMTIDGWRESVLPESQADLLLQMDIDSWEYEAILSMSDTMMRRFRIMVVEFHGLDQLWNRPFFRLASRTFAKILQTHTCVHIHPNNCCGSFARWGLDIPRIAEFTFLRSDRVRDPVPATVFPHPLDHSLAGRPPLTLPRCWYAQPG